MDFFLSTRFCIICKKYFSLINVNVDVSQQNSQLLSWLLSSVVFWKLKIDKRSVFVYRAFGCHILFESEMKFTWNFDFYLYNFFNHCLEIYSSKKYWHLPWNHLHTGCGSCLLKLVSNTQIGIYFYIVCKECSFFLSKCNFFYQLWDINFKLDIAHNYTNIYPYKLFSKQIKF